MIERGSRAVDFTVAPSRCDWRINAGISQSTSSNRGWEDEVAALEVE
jgi:hypothetical protein